MRRAVPHSEKPQGLEVEDKMVPKKGRIYKILRVVLAAAIVVVKKEIQQ